MEAHPPRWRGWMQLLLGGGLAFLFFYMMHPYLLPILLGGVVAILCYPLCLRLGRYLPKGLSAGLVTLGVVLGILLPLLGLLYVGAYQVMNLVGRTSILEPGAVENLIHHPATQRFLNGLTRLLPVDQQWLKTQTLELGQASLAKISALFATFLAQMPGQLVAFAVIVLSAYFFLRDGPLFLSFLSRLSPLDPDRSQKLYITFETSCRGVVLGLFASAGIQAVLAGIFFELTGLPNPAFAGLSTFIMGMVPVVGSAPIWMGATAYLFLTHKTALGIVMLVGGALISTADNVIRTLVMKGHGKMHPLLALVSVFGAVSLFGATGVFVGPVIAAVFVAALEILSEIPPKQPAESDS